MIAALIGLCRVWAAWLCFDKLEIHSENLNEELT